MLIIVWVYQINETESQGLGFGMGNKFWKESQINKKWFLEKAFLVVDSAQVSESETSSLEQNSSTKCF